MAILWVATVIYNAAAIRERNPVYGAVFVWTLLAIRSNAKSKKFEKIESTTATLIVIQSATMGGLLAFLLMKKLLKK